MYWQGQTSKKKKSKEAKQQHVQVRRLSGWSDPHTCRKHSWTVPWCVVFYQKHDLTLFFYTLPNYEGLLIIKDIEQNNI